MLAADGPNGTDDATRHRAAEAKGVADGKYLLPHDEALGISDLRRRNLAVRNLEDREIVRRIHPYHLRFELAFVAGGHLHLACALNHVIVGQDVSLAVNHEA